MRVLVIVPGFGSPNVEQKRRIITSNLDLIKSTSPSTWTFDVHVHIYDQSPSIPNAKNHYAPGIVGEFIGKHRHESLAYNAILIFLDDVELQPSFNMHEAISIQKEHAIDIISPTLTADSPTPYPYMRQNYKECDVSPPSIRLTFGCEMFCYLMTPTAFATWASHLDQENPWLWGMDLLVTLKFNLKVAMLPFMTAKHHFQSLSYSSFPHINPYDQCTKYLAKYNVTRESLANTNAILHSLPLPLPLTRSQLEYRSQ